MDTGLNVQQVVGGAVPKPQPVPLPSGGGAPAVESAPAPQTAAAPPPPPPRPEVDLEQVRKVVEDLNRRLDFNKFQAKVTVAEGTNRLIVQIQARETGKVVRQLPPEGILLFAEKLRESGVSGLLHDT
ncbi:MAG: flagellar protein FlaG, partial [bacterium]|nr:flagellar protein FlaG [bacterium]